MVSTKRSLKNNRVMAVKSGVSNGCLIFVGLKASYVQTADIPTIAGFTRDRFTNVISVTNKPR